jgi:acetate kinase
MDCILTINVGSSSLKFALFKADKELQIICCGDLDNKHGTLSLSEGGGAPTVSKLEENLMNPLVLLDWIKNHYQQVVIKAISHRLVHGGRDFLDPIKITKEELVELKKLIPLAPLHMPEEIDFIEKIFGKYPTITQVACFDTSFHRKQPEIATLFAIPKKYSDEGVIRYGFHGLSYEYSTSQLEALNDQRKRSKVVVAHLGNGASVCAIKDGKSIATSMGFTALDGLVMGTRCGQIDPGVIFFLIEEKGLSANEVESMLYKKSGLLGVSGITSDVKDLLASADPQARTAIELFCYRAALEIGSMITALGGIQTFVFTGGIGEKAVAVRARICDHLSWLGIDIDQAKNQQNNAVITQDTSKVEVRIIPANEELVMARHTLRIIYTNQNSL